MTDGLKNKIVETQNRIVKTAISLSLFAKGIIKRHLKIKKWEYNSLEIRNFLAEKGIKSYSTSDKLYYLPTWEDFQRIVSNDWIPYMKALQYKFDYFDCDNFSFSFASRMAELYGFNSTGVAYGVVHRDGKEFGHAFCLPLVKEGDEFKLYVFDPMYNTWAEYQKGGTIISAGREYTINWVMYF